MGEDVIPPEVREFLLARIDSIAQLEALLLLYENPHQLWTPDQVAKRLYITSFAAEHLLATLSAIGLLSCDGTACRFSGEPPKLVRTIELLRFHYRKHLIPVTNLIHGKPSRVQEFAEAFKLRKGS